MTPPRSLLARLVSDSSDPAITDDIRLTAYITLRSTELTVTLVNLGCDAVSVRESGLVLGRRRAPRELLIAHHTDSDGRIRTIESGDSQVCARIPLGVLGRIVTHFRLRPSRLKGRITLTDGRVILSKALRPRVV